jgi:hypothetical protein
LFESDRWKNARGTPKMRHLTCVLHGLVNGVHIFHANVGEIGLNQDFQDFHIFHANVGEILSKPS